MPADISGNVVAITGASSGIGAACARAFAGAKCHLVLIARRLDRIEALAADLRANHQVDIVTIALDVSDIEAAGKLLSQVPESHRKVDILVNNAGLCIGVPAGHEVPLKVATQDLKVMMDTNVSGLIAVTTALVPGMVERNAGHVINISSIAGHEAYAGGSVYCATKHAVQAYTDALRHDLVGTQIRVTAISPGAVNTEFSLVRFGGDQSKADAVYHGIEALTGEDIAEDVLYAATRKPHIQVAEIVTFATLQSSAKTLARVLSNVGGHVPIINVASMPAVLLRVPWFCLPACARQMRAKGGSLLLGTDY